MNFREKNFEKGGVISNLKNFIANLVLVQPVCGKNHNIFSEKGAGEGVKGRLEIFQKIIHFGIDRLPLVEADIEANFEKRDTAPKSM